MNEIEMDREKLDDATHDFINGIGKDRIQTNNFGCGVGKDYTSQYAILWRYNYDKADLDAGRPVKTQFVIAIPKHEMAKGEGNMEAFFKENDIPYAHLYGKSHFCTEPAGCSYKDETCADCPLNPAQKPSSVCPYYSQHWHSYVAIVPFEQVNILPRRQGKQYRDRILIYSEMPFRNWMTQIMVPFKLNWTVDVGKTYPKEIMGGIYKFSDYTMITCGLDKTSCLPLLEPKGVKEYRYYLWLKKNQGNKIYAQISKKGIQLYTFSKHLAPKSYRKVLVNCGTTPISVRKKMFGKDIKVVEGDVEIDNPVISVGKSWCKDTTVKYVSDFIEFVKAFKGNRFIVTKKGDDKQPIEEIIRAALPEVDIVHYGEIGTNTFNKEYDAAFIYGDFHYDPVTRFKYEKYLDMDEITTMEDSVVEQAMHRCRPLLHKKTPLIVMTNKKIRENPVNGMIYPRKMMMIHGIHKLIKPPTHKWGEDHGINKENLTDYRNFITLISRFFKDVWIETDVIYDCFQKGMSNKEIAIKVGKSVRQIQRVKKKIFKVGKQFKVEVKKE